MSVQINNTFNEKMDSNKIEIAMDKATREVITDIYIDSVRTSPFDTGKLRDSHSQQCKTSNFKTEALMKVGAKYWGYVEFGTSRMAARHWILHALMNNNVSATFPNYFRKYCDILRK